MNRKFDVKTQQWVDVPDDNTPIGTATSTSDTSGSKPIDTSNGPVIKPTSPKAPPVIDPNTQFLMQAKPTYITKEDGKSKDANKDFAEAELTYLTGDCTVEPNSVTLNTQAGNTVELKNLGKYLSGLYFVTEVNIDISNSGTSLTYTLLKNGFGKSFKPYVPIADTSHQTDLPLTKSTNLEFGDKVKFIEGVEATYSKNAMDEVIVPEWIKRISYTVIQVAGDGRRVLLKEIHCWTYSKYLQKVEEVEL